jgi:hypothetical protein
MRFHEQLADLLRPPASSDLQLRRAIRACCGLTLRVDYVDINIIGAGPAMPCDPDWLPQARAQANNQYEEEKS